MAIDDLYRRFVLAQLHRDRSAALRILLDEGVGAGESVADLYLRVIAPAQYQIGRLWQHHRLSVLEEHAATDISRLGMSLLHPCIVRSTPLDKLAIIACVAGERHELGARMAADFHEMAGLSVRFLGAAVGVEHLASVIRESRPDILGLSITMGTHAEALRRTVDRARSVAGSKVVVEIGGAAARSPELHRAADVDVADTDTQLAVQHAVSLLQEPKNGRLLTSESI